jgi:pimeloyl-ACP methyl ester carboxylesterase
MKNRFFNTCSRGGSGRGRFCFEEIIRQKKDPINIHINRTGRITTMATFVLVHGGTMSTDAWNRLAKRNRYPPGGHLGARCWEGTVSHLEAHGHRAFAPTLGDEHTHNLTDHIRQVQSLIECHDLRNIILVGHSYGGMVITGVAAGMPGRIRRMVYLDAALPEPNQSLFDLFVVSGVDPLSFAGLEAAPAYIEKIQFSPRKIRRISRTYIRCTESEFGDLTRFAQQKIAANNEKWMYRELPASHVPMATMPEQWYRVLVREACR